MDDLNDIKYVLYNNNNISEDVKNNIFELIVIFNNKFPEVSLDKLEKNLKTLKIKKTNKFLNKDVSMYDCKNNVLFFNKERMDEEYDYRHVLMFEIINIISSNGYQTGFNAEGQFESLNIGYTEILANYLVGNNGEKLIFPNEAIYANMIGIIAGEDKLFDSYFKNDPKILLNALVEAGNFNTLNKEANYYTAIGKKTGKNDWNQDKFQTGFISMIEEVNLTNEQLKKIGESMARNNAYLDMEPSNNKSMDLFDDFIKNKKSELGKSKSIS